MMDRKTTPQGLKPLHFYGFYGTTEVVPFQNCASLSNQ